MCCFSFLPWRDFSKAKIREQGKVQEQEVMNFPGTSGVCGETLLSEARVSVSLEPRDVQAGCLA